MSHSSTPIAHNTPFGMRMHLKSPMRQLFRQPYKKTDHVKFIYKWTAHALLHYIFVAIFFINTTSKCSKLHLLLYVSYSDDVFFFPVMSLRWNHSPATVSKFCRISVNTKMFSGRICYIWNIEFIFVRKYFVK